MRGSSVPEACAVITTEPGEEAQVDYGDGPMVRHPETGSRPPNMVGGRCLVTKRPRDK